MELRLPRLAGLLGCVARCRSLCAGAQGEAARDTWNRSRRSGCDPVAGSFGTHPVLLIKLTAGAPSLSAPRPAKREEGEARLCPEPCAAGRGSEDGHFRNQEGPRACSGHWQLRGRFVEPE